MNSWVSSEASLKTSDAGSGERGVTASQVQSFSFASLEFWRWMTMVAVQQCEHA